jgi:hypothetical protein
MQAQHDDEGRTGRRTTRPLHRPARRLAVTAALVGLAAALLVAVPGAATAAPGSKPGPVTGLTVQTAKPGSAYDLTATWNPAARATSYRTSLLTASGTVLASATVTTPTWVTTTTSAAGTRLSVKVVPLAGKRPGRAATATVTLPDLTAPQGSFGLDLDGRVATLRQESLSDDVTPAKDIRRTVDWGDGTVEPWEGTTIQHAYADGVYRPAVTLTDKAGNSRRVPVRVVVVGDETAPTGSFEVTPQSAWAGHTRVRLTQTSLSDDFSAPGDVLRVVDWQDGSEPTVWRAGLTVRHVYTAPGSYTPSVELVDEAGNAAAGTVAGTVLVSRDVAAPTTTLVRPGAAKRVRSWTRVRGTATDEGVGVQQVRVALAQKRGRAWWAYDARSGAWSQAGAKRAALKRSVPAVHTGDSGTWSQRVRGLRKGTLVVRVSARDLVGNVSPAQVHTQRLTRR